MKIITPPPQAPDLPTEPDFGVFAKFSVPVNPPGGSTSLVCFTPWVEESQKMINQARAWAEHHDLHVYTAKYRRRDDGTDHCYIILSPKPAPTP